MSKLAKIKKALTNEEPKGYQIRNPFTKYYFYDILRYYRADINTLHTKVVTLLSVTVAISAAPLYMLMDILSYKLPLTAYVPFVCLILSFGVTLNRFIRVSRPDYTIVIEVPSDEPLKTNYQEGHENELWFLDLTRKHAKDTAGLYNKLIDLYDYSVRSLKQTLVFLIGVMLYFALLKLNCIS